jgi:type II secretory pathway pseudopilin PulG
MISSHQESGFSLVETLVAITILLLVIVGPMSISSSVARSTSYSSEQVVAFFLAQEGAELAQKARDDLQLQYFDGSNENPWADFTGTDSNDPYYRCFEASGCGLQLRDGDANGELASPINCGNSNPCRLHINKDGGRARYTYSPTDTTITPYSRIITMKETSGREVEIISRVSWQTGGQRRVQTVEAKTYLFNVYKE